MAMNYCRTIAVLPSLEAIGQAVDQLVFSGFPLGQIFLVGQGHLMGQSNQTPLQVTPIQELLHKANLETVTGSNTNLKRGIVVGNLTGGIAGLVTALGLLAIPGVGEAVLAYALLYLLSSIGIGSLTGGLLGAWVGRGITAQLLKNYAAQVFQGNYLLVVMGSDAEIFRAEHILYVRGIQSKSWG